MHNESHREGSNRSPQVWLVSACLVGQNCRYDGECARKSAQDAISPLRNAQHTLIPVCPEELGNLGTPRPPASLSGGDGRDVLEGRARVKSEDGRDVTPQFIEGARRALAIALESGATHACLKARSPSCGSQHTHGAEGLIQGQGVSASLLSYAGIILCSEETLISFLEKNKKSFEGEPP